MNKYSKSDLTLMAMILGIPYSKNDTKQILYDKLTKGRYITKTGVLDTFNQFTTDINTAVSTRLSLINEGLSTFVSAIEEKFRTLNDELQDNREKLRECNDQLDILKKEKELFSNVTETNETLRSQLQETQNKLESLEIKIRNKESELQEMTTKLQTIEQAGTKASDAERIEKEILNQRINTLTGELESANKEKIRLEQLITSNVEEINGLKAANRNLESQIDKIRNEYQKQIDGLEKQLKVANDTKILCDNKASDLEKANKLYLGTIEKLERDIGTLTDTNKLLQQQLQQAQQSNASGQEIAEKYIELENINKALRLCIEQTLASVQQIQIN